MSIIPQTAEEKIAMYLKLTKRELAIMLVNSNEALEASLLREQNPLFVVSNAAPETFNLPPLDPRKERVGNSE